MHRIQEGGDNIQVDDNIMPKLRSSAFWYNSHPSPQTSKEWTYIESHTAPPFGWTLGVMNGVWAADNKGKGGEDSETLAHRVAWNRICPFNLGSWNHLAHWGCQDRTHIEHLPCTHTEIMVLKLC